MKNEFKDHRRDEVAPVAPPRDCPSGRAQASFKAISAAVGVAVKLALTQDAPPAISRKLYGNAGSSVRGCRCGAEMVGDIRCSRATAPRAGGSRARRGGEARSLPSLRCAFPACQSPPGICWERAGKQEACFGGRPEIFLAHARALLMPSGSGPLAVGG
jgi:hypothetical protein